MFTGIIQSTGKIEALERNERGAHLRVQFGGELIAGSPLPPGASIAVNGCCLTVVENGPNHFIADLSLETLARTSFSSRKTGDVVNLERPLRVGAELGGHIVQGHVDGVGHVRGISPDGDGWNLAVEIPAEISRYVVEKGSLTVDGISLTVARWDGSAAKIAVIPFTYDHTNVRHLASGDAVNLECDVLAKYVERMLRPQDAATPPGPPLTLERLIREGF